MASTMRYNSDSKDASALARPLSFEFSGQTAPNRFLKGAMTERMSSWDPEIPEARGVPSKNLINLYRRWGEGSIGLVISGNIMIAYDHLEAHGNAIVARGSKFSGDRFDAYNEMAAATKKNGSLFVGQLNHPGRQIESRIQKNPVSTSDVQLEGNIMGMTFERPRTMTEEDISSVIEGFAFAAEYLQKSGYDGIELNGAHGYLIAQFLSPTLTAYGGSINNRTRIIVDIAQSIRKRVPTNFIVGIKLNSVEFQDNGLTPEEAKGICKILEENKFDFIELTGGTCEKLAFPQRESTKNREGFFLEFAELITPVLSKTRAYITGGFKSVGAMVKALDALDGVGLARPLAQEPHLCKDILEGSTTGAIKQIIDANNFGLTNVAAGAQLRQISEDLEPTYLSRQENVDALMKDIGIWAEKAAEDIRMHGYGYPDITSVQAIPSKTTWA